MPSSHTWTSTHAQGSIRLSQSFYWVHSTGDLFNPPVLCPATLERWRQDYYHNSPILSHPTGIDGGSRTTRNNKDAPSIRKYQEFRSSVPGIWGKTRTNSSSQHHDNNYYLTVGFRCQPPVRAFFTSHMILKTTFCARHTVIPFHR